MAKQEIIKVSVKKDLTDGKLSFSVNTDGQLGDVIYSMMNVLGNTILSIKDEEVKMQAIDSIIEDIKALKKGVNDNVKEEK